MFQIYIKESQANEKIAKKKDSKNYAILALPSNPVNMSAGLTVPL